MLVSSMFARRAALPICAHVVPPKRKERAYDFPLCDPFHLAEGFGR